MTKIMLRYEFIGSNVISINLKNGYSVIAVTKWDRNESTYRMSLYLKDDTYDILDLIEEKENNKINTDKKTLFSDVSKIVTGYYLEGFFDNYIKRYEYMMKCFDKGNEFFESSSETKDNCS